MNYGIIIGGSNFVVNMDFRGLQPLRLEIIPIFLQWVISMSES